jgi:hypothetical protein
MRIIKEILLTEYIGAILVAVLIADAFSSLVTTLIAQLTFHLRFPGVVPPGYGLSMTFSIADTAGRIALYLGIAYLLTLWMYKGKWSKDSLANAEHTGKE